jgi:ATP-dependent DNA helicase RecG
LPPLAVARVVIPGVRYAAMQSCIAAHTRHECVVNTGGEAMTKDELIARLQKYEWNDVECKKAQRGVPLDVYETVSAFANTAGGWLVFGVQDTQGNLEVVGVLEVDKVQNDFLSTLRSTQKLNRPIEAIEESIEHEAKTLLVFHIPEARRIDKPVYLNGDVRKAYIRRGAGDEQCTQAEIERFIRDASERRYDGDLIEALDAEHFFDGDSVAWYRRIFHEKNPGRHKSFTHLEFLNEWGFVFEQGDQLVPTRAAVLLFGQGKYVRQILPRAVVDYQRIDTEFDQWSPDQRWHDRIVIEENLLQAWQLLIERYMRQAERPFSIDASSLRRHDDPPDYISFREAAINLLIHQDFGDHTRKPVIKFFRDRTIFWNPGDAFAATDQLLEPTEKEVRNPAIVGAFRRIGLSDQAGTGVRSIFNNWQRLGHIPPIIINSKADKTFELMLLKEQLLSEEQRLFQASLGVHLSDMEAKVFAFACRQEKLTITDAKAVTGLNGPTARNLLDHLVVQVLIQPIEQGMLYELADHLKGRFPFETVCRSPAQGLVTAQGGNIPSGSDLPQGESGRLVTDRVKPQSSRLVTDQVRSLSKLTKTQWQIVGMCDVPQSMADIMAQLGMTHRTFFRRAHLDPLVKGGVLRQTHPDQPNHPNQAYVLTAVGVELKAQYLLKERNES